MVFDSHPLRVLKERGILAQSSTRLLFTFWGRGRHTETIPRCGSSGYSRGQLFGVLSLPLYREASLTAARGILLDQATNPAASEEHKLGEKIKNYALVPISFSYLLLSEEGYT